MMQEAVVSAKEDTLNAIKSEGDGSARAAAV